MGWGGIRAGFCSFSLLVLTPPPLWPFAHTLNLPTAHKDPEKMGKPKKRNTVNGFYSQSLPLI